MSDSSTNISKYLQVQNPSGRSSGSDNLTGENSNFQLAVVVDVILNDQHPFFSKNPDSLRSKGPITVNPQQIPVNYKNEVPNSKDIDYSYIGRVKIRILELEKKTPLDKLPWAMPLDNTVTQYPLLNEQVMVLKLAGNYYYTKPFNRFNFTGTNADYVTEQALSNNNSSAIPSVPNPDPLRQSYLSHPFFKTITKTGFLGDYFLLNPFIRSVRKFEGDTVLESRFGQSIRFTAYNDSRQNDRSSNPSYALNANLFRDSVNGGYGNPRLIIRNRQRNIALDKPQQLHPKLPPIPVVTPREKNYGGQIEEDINNDGTTIEINSGPIVSRWTTTVYKSMFGITKQSDGTEEQVQYNPPGATSFQMPVLNGEQTIINSDRIVLSSRFGESLHFSKRRYGVATDAEYTVDANDQIVLTTNRIACINAPQIFLGQYGETNEPALLGQTTVDWLYDLCNWLLDHVHWYHHVHPHPHGHEDAGQITDVNTKDAVQDQTQISVQQIKLKLLRDNLHKTLSRRVYVTGGGYAPGADGVKPTGSGGECADPVIINTVSGAGVLGDFKGRNRREGPVQIEFEFTT
jgi:hypothetical protein